MNQPVRAAITRAADVLAQAGIDSARTDAELLAAHVAGTERGRLVLLESPEAGFYACLDAAVTARAKRIPLQHITGSAAFGPVRLHVGPGVFIPRPETEAILQWAMGQDLAATPVVLDLCTGSGALAVALAAALPGTRVLAVDDDPTALDYARRNAAETAVEVVAGDVTDPDLLSELDGAVHLVVANPPYIPDGSVLEPEVAQHDPAHALYGGSDGMSVIVPIVNRSVRWLAPGGLLAIEHDDSTAEATVAAFTGAGAFTDITAHRDLTGRPRFVTARRRAQ